MFPPTNPWSELCGPPSSGPYPPDWRWLPVAGIWPLAKIRKFGSSRMTSIAGGPNVPGFTVLEAVAPRVLSYSESEVFQNAAGIDGLDDQFQYGRAKSVMPESFRQISSNRRR
jgi:hypothetical protein